MWSSCWQPNSANTPCSRARSLPRATFQHEAPIHLGGRFACASAVYAGAHPDSQRIKNPASCTILSPMLRFLNHRPPSKSFPLSTLLRLPRSEEHGFQEGGTTGNRTQHWGKNRAARVAFALEDELAEIGRAPSCKSRLDNIALANKTASHHKHKGTHARRSPALASTVIPNNAKHRTTARAAPARDSKHRTCILKKLLAPTGASSQKNPGSNYFRTPVIVCSTMLFMTSGVSMPVTYPNTLPSLSIMNVVGNDRMP